VIYARTLGDALGELMADDPRVVMLGEDIVDPYGGAFKVTRGLSTAFPERVRSTPISEGAIAGISAGLALSGYRPIAEIMFGDFLTLCFDQIVNHISKYGPMYDGGASCPVIIRTPSGGGRAYGPTHSQSLQKHFVGVPGLALHEMSPFHDNGPLLREILAGGEPTMFFEDKLLYTRQMFTDGTVDDLFSYDFPAPGVARAFAGEMGSADCVVIAPGGVAHQALSAARRLLVEREVSCEVLVPSRLYPFDVAPLLPLLKGAGLVCVAEESTAGGTWGSEISQLVHQELWNDLRRPVLLVHSKDSVIPASAHLEKDVLIQDDTIFDALVEALDD
jgi:pyruvate/2-oxoglutarate/acetoin dehydrogenase E1 component